MRPLTTIAAGFALVLLSVVQDGWDLLPDAVGWALVLLGTRALPRGVGARGPLLGLGALALVVAAVTWPPAAAARLEDADPALVWVTGLPALGYVVVLAHGLARAARTAGDRSAARAWSLVRTVAAVVAVLPAVVVGGGVEALRAPAGAAAVLTPVAALVLLLLHAGRAWARRPDDVAAQTRHRAAP